MALQDDRNGKPKFGAKSEFVRSLDRSIPAARVVELAHERGMKVTAGFVYNIRSNAAHKSQRLERALPNGSRPLEAEGSLREAIAQIGLARARQILDEVEATFAGRPKRR
jgi:uncharacterized lipoprotein YddW (UPF0748 family)